MGQSGQNLAVDSRFDLSHPGDISSIGKRKTLEYH